MATKRFHIGDVLSVTGEKLVSPRLIEGVYDILNFMTHDDLFTHQLIRAREVARPFLLRQFPQLAEVDESGITQETWLPWLDAQAAKHGEYLEVEPLPEGAYQHKDPISEMKEMAPNTQIIAVRPPR